MAAPRDEDDDTTPVQAPKGYAASWTVERYHEENKREHTSFREDITDVKIAMARLESIEALLEEMKVAMRSTQAEVKQKPLKWWAVIATVFPIIMFVVMAVWQASRYPDRAEFGEALRRIQSAETELLRVRFELQFELQKKVLP